MLAYDIILELNAPVAQLDRVTGYEPVGRGFESFWRTRSLVVTGIARLTICKACFLFLSLPKHCQCGII